jgi:hypothetical protein
VHDRLPEPAADPKGLVRDKKAYRRGCGQDAEPPAQISTWSPPPVGSWPAERPVNYDQPARVPTRPQGERAVIAHLVWATHEELMPARAIRWTDTHVMVSVRDPAAPANARELVVWLRADDVDATIPRRPRPAAPPTLPGR